MKSILRNTFRLFLSGGLACMAFFLHAQKDNNYTEDLTYRVCFHYKYRQDGTPGREILLTYNGHRKLNNARLEVTTEAGKETVPLNPQQTESISVLLPPSVGVTKAAPVRIDLITGKDTLSKVLSVPAFRHWTVYIYPHSHVDIGYTNTQENVEVIHKRNLVNAMKLAKETAHYPEGARYLWNPEVTWPVERYLASATPAQKEELLDAIRKGYIHVDAGYVSTNTSASGDEELLELFRYGKKMEKLTGKKVETMVQVDIPGVSWGVVSAAAQLGIPYCLSLFNGSDRVGLAHELSFKPFWWVGPDGKQKILFLQPGDYTPGAKAKGKFFWPLMAGQTDTTKLPAIVRTAHPRDNFIDDYLASQLPELEKADYYPYDIFPMTWCMADNTPIDADLPDAVKSWNEEFAFPRLVICSATQMMKAFDEKYGDQLPVLKGDYTEYWTDGLGASAKQTGNHRSVKERLIQSETLWSMLHPSEPAPRSDLEEAWRNVILGTEHTWAFMAPDRQPISDDILNVKFGYFEKADRMSREILSGTLPACNKESTAVAVFNTHSWAHGGLVALSAEQSGGCESVADAVSGKNVPSQRLSTGELLFMAEDIPALGYKKYVLKKKKNKASGSFIHGNTLDNGIVQVRLDPLTGDIASILYKEKEFVDRKAVVAVNSYRYLKGEDSPGKASKATNCRITVKEDGPLKATLSVVSEAEGCRSLIREVSLVAGQPYIELDNLVDKIATKEKEGIHFGFAFDIPEPTVKVDIPWGIMELEKDQLPAGNRNWMALQRWLNISNGERSVTWCSLDACAFENGDMTANILGGAFKSPRWIRRLSPASTIYSWGLNNHWHTNFALSQEGTIRFRYRILPQDSKYNAVVSNRFGIEQIQPLQASLVDEDFSYDPNLAVQGDPSVIVSVVKTVNEGKSTIVRLRSVSDSDQEVTVAWRSKQPVAFVKCKVGEETAGSVPVKDRIKVPAMGVVTLRAER